MKYGLDVPNFGEFVDPRVVGDLAATAEAGGWEGFFIWDHIRPAMFPGHNPPTADATVMLSVIAASTNSLRFGALVTPLPRRRPSKFAREVASLDTLSNGRLVVGVGIGYPPDNEFTSLGEDPDARVRGDKLDEALDIATALWSGESVTVEGRHMSVLDVAFDPTPIQRPRPPVWVAATWPGNSRPIRRAARWDGIFPISADMSGETPLMPDDIAAIRSAVGRYDAGFDIITGGPPTVDHQAYEEAGATWWLEFPWTLEEAQERAAAGPPVP
jgi:alkanesulfonate monooxygenase SsuD/methylene tetrahydromethanopterin reductase-like flavin-dependent oxidoreductase (luciferase family)